MKKLIALLTIAFLMVGSIDARGGGGHHGGGHGGGHRGRGGWGHGGHRWGGRGGWGWGGVGLGIGLGAPYYASYPQPYPVPVAVDSYDVDPYDQYISLFPGTFNRSAYRRWLFRTYPSRASFWWSKRF
jgi:hypothetical protein